MYIIRVRKAFVVKELEDLLPKGSVIVRHESPVCEYCKYFAGVCPTYVDEHDHTIPTCNAFGINSFFISDTVKFTEEGLCDLIISTKPDGSKPYIIDTVESYKPNPINLCTQLLTHAALSSAYFSDKSMIEILDAARMFFGADIVENARKLVSSYNSQPDVGKPYPK